MARGYRAIVELDGKEGALLTADRLFHEWAHNKYPLEGRSVRIECDEEGIYRFGELTSRMGGHRGCRRDETNGDLRGQGQVLWSGVIVLCPSGWVMR